MTEDECAEPHPSLTNDSPVAGRLFKFSNGVMRALIGDVDTSTRENVLEAIGNPQSPYYSVRQFQWSNSLFVAVLLCFICTSVFIILCFTYRLMYGWSRRRRKSRRRPRSLYIGFTVLVFGAIVSCSCIAAFWKGLIAIQFKEHIEEVEADDDYMVQYEGSILCRVNMSEKEVLKKSPNRKEESKQHSDESADQSNIPSLLQSSRTVLEKLANLTANCSQPKDMDLQNYTLLLEKKGSDYQKGNKTGHVANDGKNADARVVRLVVDAYRSHIFSKFTQFAAEQEEERYEFINANEYSPEWKLALLLILALPALLFLTCFTGVILLLTYTVMECQRQGQPNNSCYDFVAVILQTYGYAGMVVSAALFLTTALLLLTGFPSAFICDAIFDGKNDEFSHHHHFFTVNLGKKSNISIDVKKVFNKCQHGSTIHDAMELRRILRRSYEVPELNASSGHVAPQKNVTSMLLQLQNHLEAASEPSYLESDQCVADIAEFNDTLSQILEQLSVVKQVRQEMRMNNSMKPQNKNVVRNGSHGDITHIVQEIDRAIHIHSPKCLHLASKLEASRGFCQSKPPFFQGLWVACALTAFVSIHTYPVLFDGSDMLKPRSRRSHRSGKGKKGTSVDMDDKTGLKLPFARDDDKMPPRVPNDVYLLPRNAHSPLDDAAEMYKEDRWRPIG